MLMNERRVGRAQIRDFLPESFFQSAFWAMWSAQFGVQPWHSAVEFRRALRQYLSESRTLNILSCLDISGYYQYEMIFLPLYFYLQSLGVDFQFDTKTEDIVLSGESRQQVSQLHLLRNGVRENQFLRPADIVLVNLGSTVSGSTSGNSNYPPPRSSMEADEELDENWSIWLNLRSKSDHFGEPYSFCTRQFESLMESFTVTVKDPLVFQQLASLAKNSSEAGTFIVILSSQWKLHICVPHQPVFPDQPRDVCVLWGFSNSPLCKGDFIKKPMVQCSGNEILTEALRHLNLDVELFLQHTITIPRLMPRMSAALLSRVQGDRPQVIPEGTTNIGFIGPFVENSHYSTVDISYEVRTAQKAVSELLGTKLGHVDQCRLPSSVLLEILFRK
jgi:oleate hydratase